MPPGLELRRIVARERRKGEHGLRLLPELVDPHRLAIDIGANRGIWAHEMAALCPCVWAFEPNPKLFDFLRRAAGPRVTCHGTALSDNEGEAELMVPGADGRYSNQGASLNPDKIAGAAHMRVTVRTAPLDGLDPPPVGFIKIDVEGHERAVLEGARGVIARDRPVMIIEIEERHTGIDLDTALDFVESLGYTTQAIAGRSVIGRAALDVDRDHRGRAGEAGYVNNFIFRPAA
ncbi:MAG: FkbM family methyltransferase [Oceanicaulis sp.]